MTEVALSPRSGEPEVMGLVCDLWLAQLLVLLLLILQE